MMPMPADSPHPRFSWPGLALSVALLAGLSLAARYAPVDFWQLRIPFVGYVGGYLLYALHRPYRPVLLRTLLLVGGYLVVNGVLIGLFGRPAPADGALWEWIGLDG